MNRDVVRTRPRNAGFTLIELLAAMAILSLLIGLALTMVSKARATANENACQQQLRDIANLMQNWVDTRNQGRWPKERGIKFLLKMVQDDYLKGDALRKFACPGTDDSTSIAGDDTPGSGFKDWDSLDPDCISYAGRVNEGATALRKDRLDEEVIASDDNWQAGQGRPNHGGVTNIVYADGHIGQIKTSKYKSELPDKQEWLPVGPESPDENLRKLSVD
jgi:prepilin-type N-terminal cleavage/methylation domain-containing protein/prepilin-type processing-associated H-X9-DG protein